MDCATLPPCYVAYRQFLSPISREMGLKPLDHRQCAMFAADVAERFRAEGLGQGWLQKLAGCDWLSEDLDLKYPENADIRTCLLKSPGC